MKDPLRDYYEAHGDFTGKVWQVKFETVPVSTVTTAVSQEELEDAGKKISEELGRILNEALFHNPQPDDKPVPTVCHGNQHVFRLAAAYCQCGKLKNE